MFLHGQVTLSVNPEDAARFPAVLGVDWISEGLHVNQSDRRRHTLGAGQHGERRTKLLTLLSQVLVRQSDRLLYDRYGPTVG